jgi:hypothetical protein
MYFVYFSYVRFCLHLMLLLENGPLGAETFRTYNVHCSKFFYKHTEFVGLLCYSCNYEHTVKGNTTECLTFMGPCIVRIF